MRGSGQTPTRGPELLLAHMQSLALPQPHPQGSPEVRLADQVGFDLTGLLVNALKCAGGVPRSGARV